MDESALLFCRGQWRMGRLVSDDKKARLAQIQPRNAEYLNTRCVTKRL